MYIILYDIPSYVLSASPLFFWLLWEYLYSILISSSNRKYESIDIGWGFGGLVMNQYYAQYVLLCSYIKDTSKL